MKRHTYLWIAIALAALAILLLALAGQAGAEVDPPGQGAPAAGQAAPETLGLPWVINPGIPDSGMTEVPAGAEVCLNQLSVVAGPFAPYWNGQNNAGGSVSLWDRSDPNHPGFIPAERSGEVTLVNPAGGPNGQLCGTMPYGGSWATLASRGGGDPAERDFVCQGIDTWVSPLNSQVVEPGDACGLSPYTGRLGCDDGTFVFRVAWLGAEGRIRATVADTTIDPDQILWTRFADLVQQGLVAYRCVLPEATPTPTPTSTPTTVPPTSTPTPTPTVVTPTPTPVTACWLEPPFAGWNSSHLPHGWNAFAFREGQYQVTFSYLSSWQGVHKFWAASVPSQSAPFWQDIVWEWFNPLTNRWEVMNLIAGITGTGWASLPTGTVQIRLTNLLAHNAGRCGWLWLDPQEPESLRHVYLPLIVR